MQILIHGKFVKVHIQILILWPVLAIFGGIEDLFFVGINVSNFIKAKTYLTMDIIYTEMCNL